MGFDRNATPQSVEGLLKAVDAGTLAIPEFQRRFLWNTQQVTELVRTVARDWPCGTFLLQRGPLDYRSKPIEGGPPVKKSPTLLVLDGQQRLTALYHVLKNHGDETYYVRVNDALAAEELDDDHVSHMKATKYKRLYPTLAAEAEAGIARVSTLARDEDFFAWAGHLSKKRSVAFVRFRDTHLAGLKHYSIPCLTLPEDTPLAAVVKIFETLNRTGERLDAFDLMVAKLHPHDFDLRTEYETARNDNPLLEDYAVEGLDLLRVIALIEHLDQVDNRDSRQGPLRIKGIRRSDVIDLDGATVKDRWEAAVQGMVRALKFLKGCGVIAESLAPPTSMTLALAYVLGSQRLTSGMEPELRRWYWLTSFAQTHSQGANTQAIRDARVLRTVRSGVRLELGELESFRVTEEDIQDTRRRNDTLLRGVLSAIVQSGGRDLLTGEPLQDTNADLELIPFFPDGFVRGSGIRADAIVNHVVGTAELRRRLSRSHSPGKVLSESSVSADALRSQLIPVKAARTDDWDLFVTERTTGLLKATNALISE